MSFEGPSVGFYLSGYAQMPQYTFQTLDAAMAAAVDARCLVGGITWEPSLGFTLREGNRLNSAPSGGIAVSYVYRPFAMYPECFLFGYCTSGGQYQFSTLLGAQEAALRLPDCAGITYEPQSNMYTLRVGGTPQQSLSHEVSWLRVHPGQNTPVPTMRTPERTLGKVPTFSQAYHGQYLAEYCKSGGQYAFGSLHEAFEAAARLQDCGGITLHDGSYELRLATVLTASPSGETSWLRCC
eukprot:m51a1_g9783 hypothetical protein (239) ;mRNA; r:1691215-1692124